MLKTIGVIPARYGSTRFPAKPLALIAGKSMIQRVFEQASKSSALLKVVVATDHPEIFDHVVAFGGTACMTSVHHTSGTERCFEVLTQESGKFDYLVNIQGDEPFIDPAQIDLLVSLFDGRTELATLRKKIDDPTQLTNVNVVKVVVDRHGHALYFSRSPIPHRRNIPYDQWLSSGVFYKHIGLYGYRADTLAKIAALAPSALEQAESLEQLRWLEHGFTIHVAETHTETIGVDTPEDLIRALEFVRGSE
jgi:3-deoxy-manno-octulosonate cytidylyltransferase (CMP-KDO synthetase)